MFVIQTLFQDLLFRPQFESDDDDHENDHPRISLNIQLNGVAPYGAVWYSEVQCGLVGDVVCCCVVKIQYGKIW